MGYEDVIILLGDFGRYQRRIYFLLYLTCISCAFNKMGGVFLTAKTDFRCLLPQENRDNASFFLPPEVANLTRPRDDETGGWSQCERYDVDFIDLHNTSDALLPTVKCDAFVYDKTDYDLTVTTEVNGDFIDRILFGDAEILTQDFLPSVESRLQQFLAPSYRRLTVHGWNDDRINCFWWIVG